MREHLTLPYGANEIVALRRQGKRPADMILVSLIGPLRREVNPQVIAKPGRAYDWRFLVGLDVLLVASAEIEKADVRRVADAIAAESPAYLGVWFGDKQQGQHIAWGRFRPKSKAAKRMFAFDKKEFSGIGVSA